MTDTNEFIEHYTDADRQTIAFSWNGKHGSEFSDSNQAFRWEVVNLCIANKHQAPLNLLEHLFLADCEWAVQAWGVPTHFSQLGTMVTQHLSTPLVRAMKFSFLQRC